MASIFRSEEMSLCQIFLSSEAAYDSLSTLGEIGLAQFKDLNPTVNSFQRGFVNEVRRCDEMERKLKIFEKEILKSEIELLDDDSNPAAPKPSQLFELEVTLEKFDNELSEVNSHKRTLTQNFVELTELEYTLLTLRIFCGEFDLDPGTSMTQNLIPTEEAKGNMNLGYVAGITKRSKMPVMEKMLWRVCRGNAFMRSTGIEKPLEDPVTGEKVDKVSFIIFFQGEALKSKVTKICEACKANVYSCPEANDDRVEMLKGVKTRLSDLTMIMQHTIDHKNAILTAVSKSLRVWLIIVRKVKGIYCTLNLFNRDITAKYFIAEAWIPTNDVPMIREALSKATKMTGSTIEPIVTFLDTTEAPPTLHKVNKFTKAFQKLIDAYGVATYREVNPGLYTTTTFPFLFAVMFGDCGHGIILLIFALWMVLNEKALIAQKSKNEIWNMFFGGRYIIMMMGLFSIYTGAIYNDMFSKSLSVFNSKFHVGTNASDAVIDEHANEYTLNPYYAEDFDGTAYPFGIDPIWQLSVNKINYLNSFKMKLSIIIGVLHMVFGIMLSLVNHLYFKKLINIFFEFIPQLIFLCFLFGYLGVLCIYKWFNFGAEASFGRDHGSSCAPSILILFIDMFLFKFEEVPVPRNNNTIPCSSMYLYDGQYGSQKYIILIAVLMIPLMLIPKPIILNKRIKREKLRKQQESAMLVAGTSNGNSKEIEIDPKPQAKRDYEEDEASEIFLHQGIHTIEFTLGCVSHTASYLRLWALSLAHAQLSEVLWMMVMAIGLKQASTTGAIILYFIFAAWASLTISILIVMEGLSAFLHTLRLHWVEFCSKFYEREGYLFYAFKFKHFVQIEDE